MDVKAVRDRTDKKPTDIRGLSSSEHDGSDSFARQQPRGSLKTHVLDITSSVMPEGSAKDVGGGFSQP